MSIPTLPVWRECLATALQKNANQRHCQYIQLATCDIAGVPECRTLVFRGFLENSDSLIIHTDMRSHKIVHIRENNRGEICWYFSETREQYRMAGTIEIIANEKHTLGATRQQHWQALSNVARASYYQATPGSLINETQKNDDRQIANETLDGVATDTFALLMFKPVSVDHLLLATTPHQRSLHKLNSSDKWCCKRLNP